MAPIEIDGLPFLNMVIFHGYVSHNQMVKSTRIHYQHSMCTEFSLVKSCEIHKFNGAQARYLMPLWLWGWRQR
jgi:hypothetical protein